MESDGLERADFKVSSPGLASHFMSVPTPHDSTIDVGNVVLGPGRPLEVRTVDAVTGAPILAGTVAVEFPSQTPIKDRDPHPVWDNATCTPDGVCHFDRVEWAPLRLIVFAEHRCLQRLLLDPAARQVTVRDPKGAIVRGVVHWSDGTPATKVDVQLWSADAWEIEYDEVTTDSSGHFASDSRVPPGPLKVTASEYTGRQDGHQLVHAVAGGPGTSVEVRLSFKGLPLKKPAPSP